MGIEADQVRRKYWRRRRIDRCLARQTNYLPWQVAPSRWRRAEDLTVIGDRYNMPARRIVTANDADGKSYFLHDGPSPGIVDLGGFVDEEIWIDDPADFDPSTAIDPAAADAFDLEPPAGGSRIRVFTFKPNDERAYDPEVLRAAASRFNTGGAMEDERPGMHTTATIDYGIVLQGAITLELDNGALDLTVGDIVVQRATAHAWRNHSDQPCVMAFILIASSNYA